MIASYEPFLLRYLEIDEDARIAAASSSKDSERTREAIVEQRHFLGRIREWRNPSGSGDFDRWGLQELYRDGHGRSFCLDALIKNSRVTPPSCGRRNSKRMVGIISRDASKFVRPSTRTTGCFNCSCCLDCLFSSETRPVGRRRKSVSSHHAAAQWKLGSQSRHYR